MTELQVTMLNPWRGRPHAHKVSTRFTLHRCRSGQCCTSTDLFLSRLVVTAPLRSSEKEWSSHSEHVADLIFLHTFFLGLFFLVTVFFSFLSFWGGQCPCLFGGAEGVGQLQTKVEPRREEGPKFRTFFSLSRRKYRSFLSLSGRSSVDLWPRFEAVAHPKCAFGLLWGHCVRALAAPKEKE